MEQLFYYMPPHDLKFNNIDNKIFQLFSNNIMISELCIIEPNIIGEFYVDINYENHGCFRYLIFRAVDIYKILVDNGIYQQYWDILKYYGHPAYYVIQDHPNFKIINTPYSDDKLISYEKSQKIKYRSNIHDAHVLYFPYENSINP